MGSKYDWRLLDFRIAQKHYVTAKLLHRIMGWMVFAQAMDGSDGSR
ncbi:MAG: hypothetical protein ABR568_00655 [Pyrinomonadaceae bacterium]